MGTTVVVVVLIALVPAFIGFSTIRITRRVEEAQDRNAASRPMDDRQLLPCVASRSRSAPRCGPPCHAGNRGHRR